MVYIYIYICIYIVVRIHIVYIYIYIYIYIHIIRIIITIIYMLSGRVPLARSPTRESSTGSCGKLIISVQWPQAKMSSVAL